MRKSFERTRYIFGEMPLKNAKRAFGIYINVPFCKTRCKFCPFYKEIYEEQLKNAYLEAIHQEIDQSQFSGTPKWIYFGGGTPNTLSVEELSGIVQQIRKKVCIRNMGIELLPALTDEQYLQGLKETGFTKVSFGIESLSESINSMAGRKSVSSDRIRSLIHQALELDFWVNVDVIAGLEGQDSRSFQEDIRLLDEYQPSQITTYPYMSIRGIKPGTYMHDQEKYGMIEEAAAYLLDRGYTRSNIWCFARGNDIYDSSQDELVDDYLGFGPAAFSTFHKYKMVNPDVNTYLDNHSNGRRMGFLSIKSEHTDHWRKFARMIYTLQLRITKDLPWYMKGYCLLLISVGVRRNGSFSEKGILFAHEITKTVVESLPFPIQNRACVSNYAAYKEFRDQVSESSYLR